jgi:hypothetical protein
VKQTGKPGPQQIQALPKIPLQIPDSEGAPFAVLLFALLFGAAEILGPSPAPPPAFTNRNLSIAKQLRCRLYGTLGL